ncbi:uncharacterized protein LOC142374309 isoform X2 [Odontesthes bonariensis]|uniref:uncharacterized protein LOC142374309 isoform X2 n=1 Tax=Odontesthes bonariensis TaxID=219752 RepID=UPI003F58ED42
MMDSCLAEKHERVGPVEVGDLRRDLLGEFAAPAQDCAENLQVYLRVRPFTVAERDNRESQDCVTIEGPDTVVLRAPRSCQSNRQSDKPLPQTAQRFTFTQVFGAEAGQREVFQGSVRGLVQDVLQGGNCLVFTYGVTNAGKTFTFLGPDHDSGLLPRSLSVIFSSIEGRLYGRGDLKPQRCRDFSRLTPDQQAAESSSKKHLLRLLKEGNRSQTSGRSAFLEGSSLSSDSSVNSVSEADSFSLDVSSNVRFSVWVSFCEIYKENIHDLLEQVPSGHQRRTALRLSQDVRGNSFIKDLRWVQVSSSEEAYRVMKIGKRNQSFSCTKLNQLSSRSHSIFSVRILRVEDAGVPRVLGISELALCDLAGSERCSRTHNTGERLKEAGNINSSLLTLGKCMNAMRLNQNAKFQHHVPFRESKLTHFLQFFFCGAGRVSMVVNINQNSSCFDETLSVLKFSALAQKVVVPNSRSEVSEDDAPHKSAMELSILIDQADERRKVSGRGRKSSLVAWETTLEDVQEDGEEWEEEEEEEEEEESEMEATVLEAEGGEEEAGRVAALRLVLEAQIREEVSSEFMELFQKMERDYSERLEKEREILEERAEKRVEILRNLASKTADLSADGSKRRTGGEEEEEEEGSRKRQRGAAEDKEERGGPAKNRVVLEEEIWRLQEEKDKMEETINQLRQKEDGRRRREEELEEEKNRLEEEKNRLEEEKKRLEEEKNRLEEEKDKMEETINQLRQKEDGRRRREEELEEEKNRLEEEKNRLEEEKNSLEEEKNKMEETINQLRQKEDGRRRRVEELEEEKKRLEEDKKRLEEEVEALSDLDCCMNCNSVQSSLELAQRENKALVNGIFQLQAEVTALQMQLKQQTDGSNDLSEQLNLTKSRLQDLESQSEEKNNSISSLAQEVERLKQEVKEEEGRSRGSVFQATIEELKKEGQAALQRSAQKSQQMEELQEELTRRESRCEQLREELANQRAAFTNQLQSLRAELESEGGALRVRLEEVERSEEQRRREREKEVSELRGVVSEKDRLLEDSLQDMETLRRELQRLKEELQGRAEEAEEEKENRRVEEEKEKMSVVEELKEEMQRLQERRGRRQQGEDGRSRVFEAVKREVEKLQDTPASPLRSNMADRKRTPKTTGRKRKSCEVEDLVSSENKRNRARGNTRSNKQERRDGALEKIGELIHSSPSVLHAKAKTLIGLVSGHSVRKETVATATKPRRGRKKLLKTQGSSPLLDSPHTMFGGAEEEKESDHLIIKRQLRSKTCRK